MSIYDDIKTLITSLETHSQHLTNTGSYIGPSITLEVESREQLDAILTENTWLTEAPPTRLYEGKPWVSRASGHIGDLFVDVWVVLPTVKRVCDFCDDKHDCTHNKTEVQA